MAQELLRTELPAGLDAEYLAEPEAFASDAEQEAAAEALAELALVAKSCADQLAAEWKRAQAAVPRPAPPQRVIADAELDTLAALRAGIA